MQVLETEILGGDYTADSKSVGRKAGWVRLPPPAPFFLQLQWKRFKKLEIMVAKMKKFPPRA
jgi:hypothetical protein